MLKPAQPLLPSQTLSRTLVTLVGPCVWNWSPEWHAVAFYGMNLLVERFVLLITLCACFEVA